MGNGLSLHVTDCTGCTLCVAVCPAKNKSETRLKAINMVPVDTPTPGPAGFMDQERANWDFFLGIPDMDRRNIKEGSIRDVKRSFGRNSIALRFEGGDSVLDDPVLITRVERHSDETEALLAPGADPQDVLRRLLAAGAQVTKFELVEPSLHDIFIQLVGGDE